MPVRPNPSDSRRHGPGLGITIVVALLVAGLMSISDARAATAPKEPLGPPIEYAPAAAAAPVAGSPTAPAIEPAAASNTDPLPFTGARTFGLSVLGVLTFLAGAALVRRRPRRTS